MLITGLLCLAAPELHAQAVERAPIRVLFVGNSYTFRNDLPEMYRVQARSTGHYEPQVASITDGGMKLFEHVQRGEVQKALKQGAPDGQPWDVLVLQEQSVVTSLNAASQGPEWLEKFNNAAQTLAAAALEANPNVIVVLYQTWARHPQVFKADASFLANGKDADEMAARVHAAYAAAAQQINKALPRARPVVLVSPVGDFWKLARVQLGALALYDRDGSHPSLMGTWFTSLTLLGTTTGKQVMSASKYAGDLPTAATVPLKELLLANPQLFYDAAK